MSEQSLEYVVVITGLCYLLALVTRAILVPIVAKNKSN